MKYHIQVYIAPFHPDRAMFLQVLGTGSYLAVTDYALATTFTNELEAADLCDAAALAMPKCMLAVCDEEEL